MQGVSHIEEDSDTDMILDQQMSIGGEYSSGNPASDTGLSEGSGFTSLHTVMGGQMQVGSASFMLKIVKTSKKHKESPQIFFIRIQENDSIQTLFKYIFFKLSRCNRGIFQS